MASNNNDNRKDEPPQQSFDPFQHLYESQAGRAGFGVDHTGSTSDFPQPIMPQGWGGPWAGHPMWYGGAPEAPPTEAAAPKPKDQKADKAEKAPVSDDEEMGDISEKAVLLEKPTDKEDSPATARDDGDDT